MSTMLDQLRELERLIVELGAKMGCPFEEPRDRFRPAPIDFEMDSHGAVMELNRPFFLEGFKSENPSNPRLNPIPRVVNLDTNSITENWTSEQEFLGTPPKEIHREHNNSNNSMKQITSSSTPTTSKVEALSPSTEKKISEFKEGNSKYSESHLIDLDENELSSWMRNCEEWESRALVGYLSYRNLDLHLLDADNNVDTRQIQSMLMKQHLGSAHEVFEKMSEKEIVDVDDSIGLLSTLGSVFGSMESTGSFVFDPGKSNEFPIRIGWVETSLTLVFDPGGTYVLLNEPLFRFKSIGLVASWMCCG